MNVQTLWDLTALNSQSWKNYSRTLLRLVYRPLKAPTSVYGARQTSRGIILTNMRTEQPLKVEFVDGLVVISVGQEIIRKAFEDGPFLEFHDEMKPGNPVDNSELLAKEFVDALDTEPFDERLLSLLDDVLSHVAGQGSEAFNWIDSYEPDNRVHFLGTDISSGAVITTKSFDNDLEIKAQEIYQTWADQEGYVPWVPGGNSDKQDEARGLAAVALNVENARIKSEDKWKDVPLTLEDAMDWWDSNLSEEEKLEIKKTILRDGMFFGLAHMGVRNSWGLWVDSPLALWFRENGIWHADDMSQVLSTSYWRHLNGFSLGSIGTWRAYFDAYWAGVGVTPETTEEMLERVNKL